VYHLRHLDRLAADAKVASIAGLAIVPVVALLLLLVATDRGWRLDGREPTSEGTRAVNRSQ
jgi:hypothetical protein